MALLMADQYCSGWEPRLFYDFKLAPQEWIAALQQITKTTQSLRQQLQETLSKCAAGGCLYPQQILRCWMWNAEQRAAKGAATH